MTRSSLPPSLSPSIPSLQLLFYFGISSPPHRSEQVSQANGVERGRDRIKVCVVTLVVTLVVKGIVKGVVKGVRCIIGSNDSSKNNSQGSYADSQDS